MADALPLPSGPSPLADAKDPGFNPFPDAKAEEVKPLPVRWLVAKQASLVVDLEMPFEWEGVEWRTITIRRIKTDALIKFVEAGRGVENDTRMIPMFHSASGEMVPQAIWATLDEDDKARLGVLSQDFLPATFRSRGVTARLSNTASTQPSGDTGDKSSASTAVSPSTT